jgi:hypothetical protein
MLTTLAATNSLSLTLKRKDQDIVNAIGCVRSTRLHLDSIRRDGWDKLLDEVTEFCSKYELDKLEIEDAYADPQQLRKKLELQTSIIMRWMLMVSSCIKVLLDLQADKSTVVVKGPLFPQV